MGPPNGATCSIRIFSPGRQPISKSFKESSPVSNFLITAFWPGFKSDNFITTNKAKFVELHFLTIFEIMAVTAKPQVYFFHDGIKVAIRNRNALKSFVAYIFKKEKIKLELVSFIFTTDLALLRINKKYLNHNYLTDVITFPLSEPDHPLLADIYISVNRVFENSRMLNVNMVEELHRVIFHGTLHLCGYSDKNKFQKTKMRAKENLYLSQYFNRRVT